MIGKILSILGSGLAGNARAPGFQPTCNTLAL